MENGPREMTAKECRDAFIRHVRHMIDYWNELVPKDMTQRERIEGIAFSILASLDGDCVGLPSFLIAPNPHPGDQEFSTAHGSNWWPENYQIERQLNGELGGALHESLFSKDEKKPCNA